MLIPPRRRFTMLDILVLVAATAVGLASARWYPAVEGLRTSTRPLNDRIANAVYLASNVTVPLLLAWSVADLILCLRGPRPPIRRLARQPGAIAALVATAVGVFDLAVVIAGVASHPGHTMTFVARVRIMASNAPMVIAPGVFGAWMTLALCGLWRPDRSWLDRFGRVLGLAWIGLSLALHLRTIL
jgi:hypothetical protein